MLPAVCNGEDKKAFRNYIETREQNDESMSNRSASISVSTTLPYIGVYTTKVVVESVPKHVRLKGKYIACRYCQLSHC